MRSCWWAPHLLSISLVAQNPKFAPVRTDIPMGGKLSPKEEEPVRDLFEADARSCFEGRRKELEADLPRHRLREDGGWHGNYSVYGMAYTEGVIGVFSG